MSHGTIKNYGSFSRVVDRIGERSPGLATKILAGKVKISQRGLTELVELNDSEMDTVTTSIAERGEYVPYHNTRKEIHELTKRWKRLPFRRLKICLLMIRMRRLWG